jgi:hypothetical protein
MSQLSVGQLRGLTVNNNVISVPSGHTLTYPSAIIQVVQTVKTDATAMSPGGIWGNIPGMSATITPKFSTSKIFVMVDVKVAGTQDVAVCRTRLTRDGNAIYVGDAASNRPRGMSQFYINSAGAGSLHMAQQGGNFLDSPATISPVTYQVQIGGDGTTNTFYINRTQGDRDNASMDARGASSITLMEIAQ